MIIIIIIIRTIFLIFLEPQSREVRPKAYQT